MQKIRDNLGLIFISLITILYLWLACNLVINVEDVKALKLNEKGDFLAGIFSPLAFLWLVYGYLQQGQELKQNTKALTMQAEELRISNESLRQQVVEMSKSVKAQQDMFELANSQHQDSITEKLALSRPKYIFITSNYQKYDTAKGNFSYSFELTIENLHVPLKNLSIKSNFWMISSSTTKGYVKDNTTYHHVKLDKSELIQLSLYLNQTILVPFNDNKIELQYSDFNNNEYSDTYLIEMLENGQLNLLKDTQPH